MQNHLKLDDDVDSLSFMSPQNSMLKLPDLSLGTEWALLELLTLGLSTPDEQEWFAELIQRKDLDWEELLTQASRHKILNRKSKRYTDIDNTFLDLHEFVSFSKVETVQLLESWETQVLLPLKRPLNLTAIPGLCDALYNTCSGHAEPLYNCLRKIAIQILENPEMTLDLSSLEQILGVRRPPINESHLKG